MHMEEGNLKYFFHRQFRRILTLNVLSSDKLSLQAGQELCSELLGRNLPLLPSVFKFWFLCKVGHIKRCASCPNQEAL